MSTWKRDAAIFLGSQALSLFGSSIVQFALMWYVTLETQSGPMMTLYILCGFLPTFLLSPVAGVWADRYDRKRIIMLADGSIALVTLGLGAAIYFRGEEGILPMMMAAAAARAFGAAVQQPAVGAILPQIVPVDQLTRVNGINGSLQAVIALAAPATSGALMSVAPLQVLFFIDVATATLAIGTLGLFLKIAPHAKAASSEKVTYLADLRLGIDYVRQHRYLIYYLGYLALFMVLITPPAFLTPLQVARSFGDDVWRLTMMEIVFAVGMMAGGAIIASWGGFKNRIYTMMVAQAVMACCTMGFAVLSPFWVYLIPMGIFGIVLPFVNTAATVLVQEHVESSYLGRVLSFQTMLSSSLMPLSMLLFGPLAEVVRIESILLVSGAALLCSLPLLLRVRPLVAAGWSPGARRRQGAAAE